MDKYKRLEQIIETNFRLNSLQTRELGAEMRRHFAFHTEQMANMAQTLQRMATQSEAVGELFERRMNEQADRMDEAVEAIRKLGDGNVDIRKEIAELKRRVKDLEDRAS